MRGCSVKKETTLPNYHYGNELGAYFYGIISVVLVLFITLDGMLTPLKARQCAIKPY